jgi:ATP-dependent Clp protease protease subunit
MTKNVFRTALLATSCLVLANAAVRATSSTEPRRWFNMKAEAGVGEIVIYGEIGKSWWDDDAMSAKQFDDELRAMGDVSTINVRINSPGGDAFDGIAIYNMLRNHKAKVAVSIDGLASSAASIIAMAGDTITMPQNAFLLIHGASAIAIGNQQDMQSMADDLKRLDQAIVQTYVARSGSDEKTITAIMKEDRLMAASEAKDLGLVDEVKDAVKMAAKFPLRLLPKAVADKIKAVTETSEEPAPPPAPDGEGQAEGETSPPAPTNVVHLQTKAKADGRAEAMAYVRQVNDLCALAGKSGMAAKMIADDKSLDDVRAALLKARTEDETNDINPHRQEAAPPAPSAAWKKAVDRINARLTGQAKK